MPSSDVFTYDALPKPLRIQVAHIWTSTLGPRRDGRYVNDDDLYRVSWDFVVTGLAREYGITHLAAGYQPSEVAFNFLVNESKSVEEQLDIIELTFRAIDTFYRKNLWKYERDGSCQRPDEAIEELNHRFLEHGVGYRFESGRILRIDSTYTHAEAVKPALTLLSDKRFENAEAEFLSAHKAYREGRNSDCLNEALKAFESTMKIICTQRKWPLKPTDTASKLIAVVLANGLVAASFQSQFTSLQQLLESGTPTVRNKNSGHGQGATQVVVPDYLARYALNTAAANIALLVEAFQTKP